MPDDGGQQAEDEALRRIKNEGQKPMTDSELKPCPFRVVDVIGEGYENYSNLFIGDYPLALVPPGPTQDIKKAITAWNTRTPPADPIEWPEEKHEVVPYKTDLEPVDNAAAVEALRALGDSSALPDIERNHLEMQIRDALQTPDLAALLNKVPEEYAGWELIKLRFGENYRFRMFGAKDPIKNQPVFDGKTPQEALANALRKTRKDTQ